MLLYVNIGWVIDHCVLSLQAISLKTKLSMVLMNQFKQSCRSFLWMCKLAIVLWWKELDIRLSSHLLQVFTVFSSYSNFSERIWRQGHLMFLAHHTWNLKHVYCIIISTWNLLLPSFKPSSLFSIPILFVFPLFFCSVFLTQ